MSETLRFWQFVVITLDGLSTGIMMEIMFSGRPKKTKRATPGIRVFYYWLLAILICLPSYLLRIKILPLLNLIANIGGIILLGAFFYGRSAKEGLIDFLLYYITASSAESLWVIFHPEMLAEMPDWTKDPMFYETVMCQLLALVAKISVACLVIFWKRKNKERMTEILTVICFFIAFFYCMLLPEMGRGSEQDLFSQSILVIPQITAIVLGMICFMLIVFARTSRDLRESKEYSELQESYMKLVRQSHADIEKIREEYRDFANEELSLLDQGKTDEALKLFESRGKLVQAQKAGHFCANLVINAIVSQKVLMAGESSLILKTHLSLPADLPVESLDLCRAVGNTLDNAIRAASLYLKQMDSEAVPSDRTIVFKGSLIQNHLVLSCTNPCPKNRSRKIYGTGYGQQILRSLAAKYGGDFHTQYPDSHHYLAVLSLVLPDEPVKNLRIRKPEDLHPSNGEVYVSE